jgi:hypothetical protein
MLGTVSGMSCLRDCSALTSVTFRSLTKVEADWFLYDCPVLNTLYFGQEITTWSGNYIFDGDSEDTKTPTALIALHLHPTEYDKNVTIESDGTKWWRSFQWASIDTNIQ